MARPIKTWPIEVKIADILFISNEGFNTVFSEKRQVLFLLELATGSRHNTSRISEYNNGKTVIPHKRVEGRMAPVVISNTPTPGSVNQQDQAGGRRRP